MEEQISVPINHSGLKCDDECCSVKIEWSSD